MGKASKTSKAYRRRAHRQARRQAMEINAIRESNPAQYQSSLACQLADFQRRAEFQAGQLGNAVTPEQRVWDLLTIQVHFINDLHLSPEERENLIEESTEICRRAFRYVIPYCGRPLNWSARLAMLP